MALELLPELLLELLPVLEPPLFEAAAGVPVELPAELLPEEPLLEEPLLEAGGVFVEVAVELLLELPLVELPVLEVVPGALITTPLTVPTCLPFWSFTLIVSRFESKTY